MNVQIALCEHYGEIFRFTGDFDARHRPARWTARQGGMADRRPPLQELA